MRTALVVSRYFPNDSRTVGVHQRLGTQVQALAKVVDRVDCLFLQPVERHYAAAELQEHERRLRRLWSAAVWIRVAPTLVDDEPASLWQRRGRGVFDFHAQRIARPAATFVCSESDRRYLARFPGTEHVQTIPNSVEFPPADERDATEPLVLFVGSMGYRPNIQAVDLLVQEIWPAVRAQVPAARLA